MDSAKDEIVRERATTSGAFDPAEIVHGDQSQAAPSGGGFIVTGPDEAALTKGR